METLIIHSILGSWDAEEFGLQGSTEWVESHLPWLQTTAVAYLNMDVGVSGPRTAFSGSGEIQTFVVDQMKKILFPEGWGDFPTLYDMWFNVTEGEISPLGSGSDYASFYQNGIGCVRFPKELRQPYDLQANYNIYIDRHRLRWWQNRPHLPLPLKLRLLPLDVHLCRPRFPSPRRDGSIPLPHPVPCR